MLLGDGAVFFACLYVALVVRNLDLPESAVYQEHIWAFMVLFVLYELVLYIAGFWGRQIIPTAKNIFELLVPAHLLATGVMVLYFYFLPTTGISPKTNLVIFTTVLFGGMFVWKIAGLRLFTLYPIKAVIVGSAQDLVTIFRSQPLWNIKIVQTLSNQAGLEEIQRVLDRHKVDTIIVDLDRYPRIDILYKLMFADVSIIDIVALREEISSTIDLERIDQDWFLAHISKRGSTYRVLKRSMDVGAGVFLGLVFLCMYPVVWLAMQIEDGKHVLLRNQTRIGQRGREFRCFKFRTMAYDEVRWQNKGDQQNYVTTVGRFLRKSRLDEFPQCINLIRGDISLVGPRPILLGEHQTMVKRNPFQQARLLAQPGITGHAQVSQQHAPENEEEALERLSYDLYYIKNLSLWLDIKIILKTLKKLAQRAGMK